MSSKPDAIPLPAVRRLSLYLRQLESLARDGRSTISSRELGKALGMTDAQVRKDLAYFGQFGHPGIGYRVDEVIQRVRHILGTDRTWNTALVGAGHLGQALVAYRGFERKGFRLVAVFDSDRSKAGLRPDGIENLAVQPLRELPQSVARLKIMLAMIAVPAAAAQAVADQLVAAGVRGILNFAPVALNVPDSVAVSSVDLAVRLEQLSFQVNSMRDPPLRSTADGHK
jgi:redox-sensing transcriptional repressor